MAGKDRPGRKPTNATAEEVREKLAKYLKDCEEKKRPISVTRMSLALGYNSRQTFHAAMDGQVDEGVREALREAHSHYVASIEEQAMTGKGGGLMLLLNSQGYVSKSESKQALDVHVEKQDKAVALAKLMAGIERRQLEQKPSNLIEGECAKVQEVADVEVEDWI